MITLSLDEQGDFEDNSEETHEPVFIAGLLYDDKGDKRDNLNEKKRIEAYYMAALERASGGEQRFSFPDALHSNGDSERDRNVVGPAKRRVNEFLPEFLRKGTADGKELLPNTPRRGEYYLFAILKSEVGMGKFLGTNSNYLLRDNYGSNLYFHMAHEIVSRALFHNPLIQDISEIALRIATRSSDYLSPDDRMAREYSEQGYKKLSENRRENTAQYSLTNADIYRTAISQEMMRSDKSTVKIDSFEVKSINYSRNNDMEFLYMADTICTYLGHKVGGDSSADWLKRILDKSHALLPKDKTLVFAYDEIDVEFKKAWEAYEYGRFYDSLRMIYDARLHSGKIAGYYSDKWFKILEDRICGSDDAPACIDAINRLHRTLTTNELDQDRTIYILERLEHLANRLADRLTDDDGLRALYALNDIGVTSNCHIGNSRGALEYFDKCKTYAYWISIEDYLATLNRIVETLLDNFDHQNAKQIAEESLGNQRMLLALRSQIPIYREFEHETSLGLCKALSQNAQVYAFLRDRRCVELFKEALKDLPEDTADHKITQSYLLHYYLDTSDKEAYEEEATKYFGGESTPSNRFKYIMNEAFLDTPVISYRYALYVFLRGVYLFELDRISDGLIKKLYDIDSVIKKAEVHEKGSKNSSFVKLTGHPSELIFKYLSLIAVKRGETDLAVRFIQETENRLMHIGPTIRMIIMFGRAEYLAATGNMEERNKLIDDIVLFARENFESLKNYEFSFDPEERFAQVSGLLSYMYH